MENFVSNDTKWVSLELLRMTFLLEQVFCFSKRLAIGRGKVLLGNMPSKYTRNFLRVLYFPKN
jgi:hypothetical protein